MSVLRKRKVEAGGSRLPLHEDERVPAAPDLSVVRGGRFRARPQDRPEACPTYKVVRGGRERGRAAEISPVEEPREGVREQMYDAGAAMSVYFRKLMGLE